VKWKICLLVCLTNSLQILKNSRQKAVILPKIEIRNKQSATQIFQKIEVKKHYIEEDNNLLIFLDNNQGNLHEFA
jgi:hypothetical protein